MAAFKSNAKGKARRKRARSRDARDQTIWLELIGVRAVARVIEETSASAVRAF